MYKYIIYTKYNALLRTDWVAAAQPVPQRRMAAVVIAKLQRLQIRRRADLDRLTSTCSEELTYINVYSKRLKLKFPAVSTFKQALTMGRPPGLNPRDMA